MSGEVWIAIGVIVAIVWGVIIYQIYNAPLMPDDYGIIDDEYQQWIEDNTRFIEKEDKHEDS